MALKIRIAAALAALTVTSAASVVAYAEAGNFELYPKAGQSDVIAKKDALKKESNYNAAMLTTFEGIKDGIHVTFRVREFDGAYATNYAQVYKLYADFNMEYLSGHGEIGKTYRLAASLDRGQALTSTYVEGVWEP